MNSVELSGEDSVKKFRMGGDSPVLGGLALRNDAVTIERCPTAADRLEPRPEERLSRNHEAIEHEIR